LERAARPKPSPEPSARSEAASLPPWRRARPPPRFDGRCPIFPSVNIRSGTADGPLAAALTNPTELARRKGRFAGTYPVTFRRRDCPDAEAAFQAHKTTTPLADRETLMAEILAAKLEQHPKRAAAIRRADGEPGLATCSHVVHGRGWWEGYGFESPFIRALVVVWRLTRGRTGAA